MGRKISTAENSAERALDLLLSTLKKKKVRLQDVSKKLGRSPTWLTGLVSRKQNMYIQDFFRICEIYDIDPVEMLATDGFLKYVRHLSVVDVVKEQVNQLVAEMVEGQEITFKMPKKRDRDTDGHGSDASA